MFGCCIVIPTAPRTFVHKFGDRGYDDGLSALGINFSSLLFV